MQGFGVHTSMWTMEWTTEAAERTVKAAVDYKMDFIEIALLNIPVVDAQHTKSLLEKNKLRAVCSLGLPEGKWASTNPEGAIEHLKAAIDKTSEMGCEALSGVVYGGIGERTGLPPTEKELDNVARALTEAGKHAKKMGILFGVEPVNRYETHLLNTAAQGVAMLERIGADNIFLHLDTYHMNIEEKGVANGILDAKDFIKYIHLSESDRGTPGWGTCDWDEIYGALAAINFKGGLAMESFINMPPEVAYGLSVWRPVAKDHSEVMDYGLPFLRSKAKQYRLI
jgi:D-psicose/D-tagatose/L-ribulose 3-epimerase